MSCEKNLRSNILPSSDPGGTWTYIGYDSSSPTGTFEDTPTQSLVLVDVGEQVGTDDNPLVNPTDATPGFYKFRYTVITDGLDPTACTTTNDIIIQVTQGPCSGADNTVNICTDEAPLLLSDLLEDAAECSNFSLGVVGGTALDIPSYNETTTQIDPSTTNLGTYTFINTTAPVVQNGFSLGCTECASSTSTLTFTITQAYSVEKTGDLVICHLDDTEYSSGDFVSSSNTSGRWVYVSGSTTDASLIWGGQPINVSANTLLGNQLNVTFKANGLPIGDHFLRYYASESPCERFEEVKISVVSPPNSGVFIESFQTLCGSSSCSSTQISSMIWGEDLPDPANGIIGVFNISTDRVFLTGESVTLNYGSSSLGSTFTFDENNPAFNNAAIYGNFIRFTVDKPTVFNFDYTITKDGCTKVTSWTTTVYPASTLITTPSPNVISYCSQQTGTLLFKNVLNNFQPGGIFTLSYRPDPDFGTFTTVQDANLGLIGNPGFLPDINVRPTTNEHSLTAGINFDNPGLRPGYYRVAYKYFGAPANSNAFNCSACKERTVIYFIRYSNGSCGCNSSCVLGVDPVIEYSVGVTPAYNSNGNTYTSFNLRTALAAAGYDFTALRCGSLPNYNLWSFYNQNNVPVTVYNQLNQPVDIVNFSTLPYGTYSYTFRPTGHTPAPPGTESERLCYQSSIRLVINLYNDVPCEISQVTVSKIGSTLYAFAEDCSSPINYTWVGPNSFTSTNQTISPPRPGTYTVTANCPVSLDCTSTASYTITCDDLALQITDGLNTPNAVEVSYFGFCTSPTYKWTINRADGTTNQVTTTSNILDLTGQNVLEIFVELVCGGVDSECFADFSCGVTADIINNGQTLTAQYNGCTNNRPTDYLIQWNGPNGYTSNAVQITPPDFGTYTLTVTCLTSGCVATTSITISGTCNLQALISILNGNVVGYPSGDCLYGQYRYTWDITNPSQTLNDVSVVPYEEGRSYTVTIECDGGLFDGCSSSATFTCPNFTINIQ